MANGLWVHTLVLALFFNANISSRVFDYQVEKRKAPVFKPRGDETVMMWLLVVPDG